MPQPSPLLAPTSQPITGGRTLLRLATAGSVDDGKSTLVGRLLFDTNSVLTDTLDHVERVSKRKGLDRADLALLTDGLRAEREQGITIDVAYRYFATPARKFILADCPGHVQYTRNTVTGSSTADVIVLLVDARKGVVEQTRRHLAVASLLRVPHVVLVVNKIDLVDYSEDVFTAVATDFALLARSLGVLETHCIPVSATEGDNVVTRSHRTPWYDGPTVLGYLENIDDTRLAVVPTSGSRCSMLSDLSRQLPHRGLLARRRSTVTTVAMRARSSQAEYAPGTRWWCYHAALMPSSKRSTPPTVPLI